jgi:concanavalin A-like lectin/glucanase superfamily protein/HYDIN/CFA65/VesB family protein
MEGLWTASFGSTRRVRSAVCAVLAMGALGLTAATASASATLRADYQFQNTLTSSFGAPPALTNLGPSANSFATETVNGSSQAVLTFPAENGVQLAPTTNVIANGNYTIVVLLRFATLTNRAWQRIVDFQNGTSDRGLYSYKGTLELYPYARGTKATIKAEEYVLVVLTRNSAGTVIGYVNGAEQFSYDDSSTSAAVIDPNNKLRFFRDNETGGPSGESSAGAVARIQLYDDALTAEQVAGLFHDPGSSGTASANAESLSFAKQMVDTIGPRQTVVVTNTGRGDLSIHHARMTGANLDDFLLSSDTCSGSTLLVGQSCSIGVRFAPSASGQSSATLLVSSDDPLSPLNITLSGTGYRHVRHITCKNKITGKIGKHGHQTRRRCVAKRHAAKRHAHRHRTGRVGHRHAVR